MCVKLSLGDLNLDPHPTSTYTCEVIIAPRVYGGGLFIYFYLSLMKGKRN